MRIRRATVSSAGSSPRHRRNASRLSHHVLHSPFVAFVATGPLPIHSSLFPQLLPQHAPLRHVLLLPATLCENFERAVQCAPATLTTTLRRSRFLLATTTSLRDGTLVLVTHVVILPQTGTSDRCEVTDFGYMQINTWFAASGLPVIACHWLGRDSQHTPPAPPLLPDFRGPAQPVRIPNRPPWLPARPKQ